VQYHKFGKRGLLVTIPEHFKSFDLRYRLQYDFAEFEEIKNLTETIGAKQLRCSDPEQEYSIERPSVTAAVLLTYD
jgi:hypothetical protein